MGNLLFSPNGRIGPSDFLRGLAMLALVAAVIAIAPLINYSLASILSLASLLIAIPTFFILIKRCHDAGKSGWMSILFFIMILFITGLLQYFAQQATGGEEMAAMKAASQELATSGAGFGEIMTQTAALAEEYGPAIAKNTALATAIAGFVGTMLGGYLTNLMLKQEPHENRFGPAPM
ncbi:DUF805 domain-containing protein [Litorimonas sp. RW-G-Af-16]|uniref:DUF805 domain-containing protein n=1 Tax=Litorimonas sp. RW-G-Af-16 TaxID=3241168 RepID=UPI00390C718E